MFIAIKIFTDNARYSLNRAENEARNLQQAKQNLEERRQLGQTSGEQVLQLANDLGISSRQQASGANEQVAAVVEVTTSMEELSETARQISLNVQQVADSSSRTLDIAKDVNESTLEAAEVAQRGRQVIEASIQGIEQVRNRIEALAQRLLVLTERSEEIGAIIDVINGIADETHLLALNAAIESAGAGEAGRRFAIVASEIKNLADRSIEATRDVRRIIVEVQGAVASAVLVAEEGKKETVRAVERSYQSGLAINEIGQVVNLTSNKGANIVEYVENVNRLTEEIRLATRQQQSASNQIVSTMRSIGEVAQQSASSSTSLNFTIENLRELSRQLTGVLTK